MICPGCYKEHKADGFCYSCRHKMFAGKKISPVLDFDEPKTGNREQFQEKTKRLSISGVQLKYSLKLEEDKLVLTDKGGEYILKPIPPSTLIDETNQTPENEHLTMQIAAQVFGIETADSALISFKDGSPAYITKRFDVRQDGSHHQQEDLCQVLGRSRQTHGENFKYDGNYLEIADMIRKYIGAYPAALENFFRQILFNYLFSNGDAHLKNFSFIRSDSGDYQLSPAYDMLSTVLHSPHESDTALDLYENSFDGPYHSVYGCYGQAEFRLLAEKSGIKQIRSERILTHLLSFRDEVVEMINRSSLREDIKVRYQDNYLNKLKRMGMTKTMIGQDLTIKNKSLYSNAGETVALHIVGNKQIIGEFILTPEANELDKENKYSFLEEKNKALYKGTADNTLITIIDGDLLTGVSRLSGDLSFLASN